MWMKHFDTVQKRLHLLLEGEILDRCCIAVTAPKDPMHPYIDCPEASESWYMDADRILKRNLERLEKTYFAGDAFPYVFPYFGTGGHAKYFNDDIPVAYQKDTIWIHPYLESCADLKPVDVTKSRFFRRELEIMEYLVRESRGHYFVSMPDNCGSYDALAQLRGTDNLLMDMLDEPEEVKQAAGYVVDALRDSSRLMFDAIRENNLGGSTHSWLNLHSKGRIMQLQCDLSVMISADLYDEFIMEELRSTLAFLDNAIYHIDGQEQIRHLDLLLSLPQLNMCQWTPVAGQPDIVHFIPVLQRIQAAGKGLSIVISKKFVKPLIENLSPKGLQLVVNDAASPEEADEIVNYVDKETNAACKR